MIGQIITHKKFGEGTIVDFKDNGTQIVLRVSFSCGEKSVVYSSAYKHLYQFEDANKQKELDEMILRAEEQQRIADEQEKQRIVEEQKKQEAMAATAITMSGSAPKKRIGVGSSSTIITTNMLLSMHSYGTVAQAIYDCCCSAFGWDNALRGRFGGQQELYAENATPEHYSVWFLAHSTWTGSKNGKWSNEIYDGIKHIKEHWDDITNPRFASDDEIRVVFAKKSGAYFFLGIYKCISIDSVAQTKTYELIADEYKPQNILSSNRGENANCMSLADNTILTLHDSDCATFSYENKIRVTIKESGSSKELIHGMYQARDGSDPIRVFEGDTDLGEWEVEEWGEEVDQNGEKYQFFQLIPFLHISLTQHPNKMYSSWTVISKHVVSYQIEDKDIRLDFEENRMKCGSINAVISDNIYKKLKSLFRSYYNNLNTNSGSSHGVEQAVMERVPFGGVSVMPYSYHIGTKQATYVSPLFIDEPSATSLLNKIINDIENVI